MSINSNMARYLLVLTKAFSESEKTRDEIAQEIGVSTSTLSDWTKGRYFPKKDKIDALAKSLNISSAKLRLEIARAKVSAKDIISAKNDITANDEERIHNAIVKKIASTANYSLKEIVEIANNILAQTWTYPSIIDPVPLNTLKDPKFLNSVPRVTLPNIMLGRYARSQSIIMTPMPDRGMNIIFDKLSLLAIDINIDIDNLDGNIVLYWRNDKFYVRKMFKSHDGKYIMRPESRIPVFVDTVLKPDEFELIGKVVMYTNTI